MGDKRSGETGDREDGGGGGGGGGGKKYGNTEETDRQTDSDRDG